MQHDTAAATGATATDTATGNAVTPTDLVDRAENAVEQGLELVQWLRWLLEQILQPQNAYQVGIVVAAYLLAWGMKIVLGPRLYGWMRSREGWPKWRLRLLVVIHQRLRMIFFATLMWIALSVIRRIWPGDHFYVLTLAANLALAWLIVAFATRLIANSAIRSVVRWGAWIWITLRILGMTEEAVSALDSIAFTLGDMRLSLWLLVQAVISIGALFLAARFLSKTSASRIEKSQSLSPSFKVLMVKVVQVFLFGAAFFIGLKAVGVDLTGLAVLSGAIGVGLGFGLQKVVSNLVSGVIILLDKSIKPGDVISLGDTFGWINSLGARYVSVVTRDGKEYLIPNEDLITGQVVNWSHSNEFVRLDIYFGTAYADDPHKVRKIAVDAAAGVDRVLSHRPPVCHIVGFGDSSVDYILRFWIKDPTGGLTNIRGNVYLALWDAFQEAGISIPFPQREVRMLGETRVTMGDGTPQDR